MSIVTGAHFIANDHYFSIDLSSGPKTFKPSCAHFRFQA